MLLKKMFAFAIAFVVCVTGLAIAAPTTAHAAEGVESYSISEVSPRWSVLASVFVRLDEDPTGYASPFYTVVCNKDLVNKIRFVTTLQMYNGKWTNVKTWDKTMDVGSGAVSHYEEYKVTKKGYSYRFNYTIEVKKGTKVVESTTGTSPSRVI